MDKLEKYVINHSSCGMPRCEYVENGADIDCDECQKRMIAEHDAKVRAEERAEIQSELMAEIAMLNETKMTMEDLKCFAYRIKAIAE